ncbi:hypothetical protein J6590_049957 [Homalodisca vitripennis]|nr:hypothetical protein J6590_049957 [Homalodisca vitripennis]
MASTASRAASAIFLFLLLRDPVLIIVLSSPLRRLFTQQNCRRWRWCGSELCRPTTESRRPDTDSIHTITYQTDTNPLTLLQETRTPLPCCVVSSSSPHTPSRWCGSELWRPLARPDTDSIHTITYQKDTNPLTLLQETRTPLPCCVMRFVFCGSDRGGK